MILLRQKIEELVLPFLKQYDAFLVDIKIGQYDNKKSIQIFADTDTGITIQQCAEISRGLSKLIDEQNIIEHSFNLEVSSPDITRPLKLLRQYKKNIGRKFNVKYKNGDSILVIKAKLFNIENETLIFEDNKLQKHDILYNNIIESIEELPW